MSDMNTLIWREHQVWTDPLNLYIVESTAHNSFIAYTTDKSAGAPDNWFHEEFPTLEEAKARCQKHFNEFGIKNNS